MASPPPASSTPAGPPPSLPLSGLPPGMPGGGPGPGNMWPFPGMAPASSTGSSSASRLLLLLLLLGVGALAVFSLLTLTRRMDQLEQQQKTCCASSSSGQPATPGTPGTPAASVAALPEPLTLQAPGSGPVTNLPNSRHKTTFTFTLPSTLAAELDSSRRYGLQLAWAMQSVYSASNFSRVLELRFTDGTSRYVAFRAPDTAALLGAGPTSQPPQRHATLAADSSDADAVSLEMEVPHFHKPSEPTTRSFRVVTSTDACPGEANRLTCNNITAGGAAPGETVSITLAAGVVLAAVVLHVETDSSNALPSGDARLSILHVPLAA